MDRPTILAAAMRLAETRGYENVFKRNISLVLGCGMGTVNYHWGTMKELRTAIVQQAVRDYNKRILQQALAVNHHAVRHLTAEERRKVYAE